MSTNNKEYHRNYMREYRKTHEWKAKAKKTRQKNALPYAHYRLNYLYKMTLEEYDFLLESQGGGCALCGKTPEENGKRLAVDHDHSCCPGNKSCGECVRGLLCDICNTRIDWYADLPDKSLLDLYLGGRSGNQAQG